MADQRQYSRISAGQPLQSRAETAAQAAAAQEADQQIDGRGRARGNDADSLKTLFQRTRPRQAVACDSQGQEAARQAREREEARLEQGEGPIVAGEGVSAALILAQRLRRCRG